jgi:hypothetical protein
MGGLWIMKAELGHFSAPGTHDEMSELRENIHALSFLGPRHVGFIVGVT